MSPIENIEHQGGDRSDSGSTLDQAIKDLRLRWVVRQQVRTVDKSWMVDIFDTDIERLATQSYVRLVAENPDDYFELVAVIRSEVCLQFTAHKGR